jgi:hypothetical protein
MAEKEPKKKPETKDDSFDHLTDEEKIDSLIKSLEEQVQPEPKKELPQKPSVKKREVPPTKKQSPLKKRLIMIKFGGAYHPNFYLNLFIGYWVNLVVAIGVLNLFNLGQFPEQLWIALVFVFIYTALEWLFREWMIQHYSQIVLMSFGLVYFIGYTTLFFLIDAVLFTNLQIFNSEIEVVAFTLLFMIVRYALSYVIQKGINWRRT